MIQYFKRGIYILLFCLLATVKLMAQDPQYFIYIQHEKSQPFYVKYNGKVLSSSERGYIILSELPAGAIPITIGFAKEEAPEQQFKIKVTKDDQGFLLKRTDEKSYALYNLQTFAVTMAGSGGAENGRLQPLDSAAAAVTDIAPQPDAAQQAATETAETVTPAPPAADTNGQAMMAALRKDLDSAMAGKADVSATSKPAAPAKKTNKFAESLDKVVSDDRPDDIPLEEPATPAPAAAAGAPPVTGAVADAAAAVTGETKKGRRKRNKDKERAPLTEEEQALLKSVMAEEQQAAQADSQAVAAPDVAAEKTPATETPVADTPKEQPAATSPDQPVSAPAQVPVATADAGTPAVLPATEEAPEKKSKRSKKKKDTDPQFIEFMDDSTQQRVKVSAEGAETTAPAQVTEAPAAVATDTAVTESKREKRKKRKLAEIVDSAENPNNIVKDSVDYDAPRRSREAKKEADAAALKMINSDCENLMDDASFRKLLRKFVAAKDDEGMVDAFRRNTKGYCLETNQIRRLAQLVNKDEYRYQLLDMAYPKAYDSEKYAGLSDLLVDSYYQGRFKAMLHK